MTTLETTLAVLLSLTGCSHADLGDAPAPTTDEDLARSALQPAYQAKQLGADHYAVDLAGGVSELESGATRLGLPAHEPKAVVRVLTGRVVDDEGLPVAGALVIGGERLSMMLGNSLTASHAVTTDDAGEFSMPVTTEASMSVLALVNPGAWSAIKALPAGSEDSTAELEVVRPSGLTGAMTRGGAATAGTVLVRDRIDSPSFMLRFTSDDEGHYQTSPLPPGDYVVSYLAGRDFAAMSTPEVRDISLAAGVPVQQHVDLVKATDLQVSFDGMSDPRLATMSFTLVAGHHTFTTPKEVAAYTKTIDQSDWRAVLQGGIDLMSERRFGDVEPGRYTICLHAEARDATLDFQCRKIEVDGGDEQKLNVTMESRG